MYVEDDAVEAFEMVDFELLEEGERFIIPDTSESLRVAPCIKIEDLFLVLATLLWSE